MGSPCEGFIPGGRVLDVYSTAGTLQGACACQTTGIFQANDFGAQRGRADFDLRQQFSADGVWTLPNPWSRGWEKDTLGGWRLGGVVILQTGLPFTVYTTAPYPTGDFNADGNDYDVPNTPLVRQPPQWPVETEIFEWLVCCFGISGSPVGPGRQFGQKYL